MMDGMLWVLQEMFFESLPARGEPSSTVFNNSKNLASSSQELRLDIAGNTLVPERVMRREPKNSSIPVPRFQNRSGIVNNTGGNYSHGGTMAYTRFPISDVRLGKLQSWKCNFRTEVCQRTNDPRVTFALDQRS